MEIGILVQKLESAAKALNSASDELGKSVMEIDARLKVLNIGIVTWLVCAESPVDKLIGKLEGWERSFGYARVKGKWGLACQSVVWKDDHREVEVWLFNEAPRWMRVEMIGKLPELMDAMVARVNEMSAKLVKKRLEAEAMLGGMKQDGL